MGLIRKDYDPPDGAGHFTHLDPKPNQTTITVKTADGGSQDLSGPETEWARKQTSRESVSATSPAPSIVPEQTPLPPAPPAPQIERLPDTEAFRELAEELSYLLRQAPFTLAWTEKVAAGEALHISYGSEQVWVIHPQDLPRLFEAWYRQVSGQVLPMTGAPPSTAAQFALALLQ